MSNSLNKFLKEVSAEEINKYVSGDKKLSLEGKTKLSCGSMKQTSISEAVEKLIYTQRLSLMASINSSLIQIGATLFLENHSISRDEGVVKFYLYCLSFIGSEYILINGVDDIAKYQQDLAAEIMAMNADDCISCYLDLMFPNWDECLVENISNLGKKAETNQKNSTK